MLLKAKTASVFLLPISWHKSIIITLLFAFAVLPSTLAQQSEDTTISLLKVLKQVEDKFDVKFSYNRKDIKLIEIDSVALPEKLASTLKLLAERAGLKFTQIKDRYIAVQLEALELITVCGILIETENSTPIVAAEIIVSNQTTTSDSGGNFSISNISERETLSILVNGFLVRKIQASELQATGSCPFIFISQTYTYLPEVVLKNYITRGISKDVSGAITISNDNFDILPSLIEPDVLQIAQALPGIESADETAANLNVRGGTSDEFLILWDDIRMYQTGHFFGLISAFDPNLTKNVRLYKNGTNARFGEGVSGVMAMESLQDIPEDFSGGIGINFTSANAHAEIPASENFLITLSGRTAINTGIGNPVYNEFFNKVFQNTIVTNLQNDAIEGERTTDEAFNFFDISTKALWQLSKKDQLSYHFLIIDNRLQFSERVISNNSGSLIASELKQQSSTNALSYTRSWNSNLSTKFLISNTNYRRNELSNNVDLNLLNSNQNAVVEKAVKFDLDYKLNNDLFISGGYQYIDTQITDASQLAFNMAINQAESSLFSNAVYVAGRLTLFDKKTSVSGGLRYTNYPKLSTQFLEPRLHVAHEITNAFRLNLSGELKHQSVYQRVNLRDNLLGIETQDWLLADTETNDILESKQVGIGGSFNKSNWTVSSEIYTKIVGGINTSNLGFRNQLQDTNVSGSYTVNGAELSINKRTEAWNIWMSYSFQDNTYRFDALQTASFRNNLETPHTLNLAASYTYKDFNFSIGNTFKSGLPYTSPITGNEISTTLDENVINFNTPNNARLPSYFRTDFSASYQLKLDKTFTGNINVAFLNVLNRKNALDRYYVLDQNETGAPTLRRVDQFSLGFTPNISLQLLF